MGILDKAKELSRIREALPGRFADWELIDTPKASAYNYELRKGQNRCGLNSFVAVNGFLNLVGMLADDDFLVNARIRVYSTPHDKAPEAGRKLILFPMMYSPNRVASFDWGKDHTPHYIHLNIDARCHRCQTSLIVTKKQSQLAYTVRIKRQYPGGYYPVIYRNFNNLSLSEFYDICIPLISRVSECDLKPSTFIAKPIARYWHVENITFIGIYSYDVMTEKFYDASRPSDDAWFMFDILYFTDISYPAKLIRVATNGDQYYVIVDRDYMSPVLNESWCDQHFMLTTEHQESFSKLITHRVNR